MSLAPVPLSMKQYNQLSGKFAWLSTYYQAWQGPHAAEGLHSWAQRHPLSQFSLCQFLSRLAVPVSSPTVLSLFSAMAETWKPQSARFLYDIKVRMLFHSLGEEPKAQLLGPSVSHSSTKQLYQQPLCLNCEFLRRLGQIIWHFSFGKGVFQQPTNK